MTAMRRNRKQPQGKSPAELRREEELAAQRPWDGETPPAIPRRESREMKDRALHKRIGPAVPVPDDEWY